MRMSTQITQPTQLKPSPPSPPQKSVITAQVTLLNDQETALQVQEQRLTASVALVQALGGGWDTDQLPSKQELQKLHLFPD